MDFLSFSWNLFLLLTPALGSQKLGKYPYSDEVSLNLPQFSSSWCFFWINDRVSNWFPFHLPWTSISCCNLSTQTSLILPQGYAQTPRIITTPLSSLFSLEPLLTLEGTQQTAMLLVASLVPASGLCCAVFCVWKASSTFFPEIGFHCAALAGLELEILLLQSPRFWDYRCVVPQWTLEGFLLQPGKLWSLKLDSTAHCLQLFLMSSTSEHNQLLASLCSWNR
jgi:hypothetical protein